MHVLNLVTNMDARFFVQQVETLESLGVDCTNMSPAGRNWQTDRASSSRSALDYLEFYPRVLRQSFGSYDLIHANYGLTGPAAILQPNLPVVLSLWGSDLFEKYGPLSQRCARHADAVIVMSEEMARELRVPAHVIPHGVDLERFKPIPKPAARELVGWRDDARHVLFPYPKQRDVKDYPRAERIVEAVRQRVDEPVELHTLFNIPHEEMSNYYNAADVLLLTSRHEGSPNSVKEAMACDLPIVATDVGDVRERIEGVDLSFVCRTDEELIDGVCAVLDAGTGSNGREVIRPLSVENMGRQIKAIYEDVLDR
jgi:glycosyltransferase involved in cell wall biosynthesis